MRTISRLSSQASSKSSSHELIRIRDATFYRNHPSASASSPPLFQNLSFSLPRLSHDARKAEFWAIIGPSSSGKTTLLEILRGGLICLLPVARSFPYLSHARLGSEFTGSRNPRQAIQYVGFGDANDWLTGPSARGAYLSARYESRREATDFSLLDYLRGTMSLNPSTGELEAMQDTAMERRIYQAAELLKLTNLLGLPVGNLSNGQTRRARIAKALMQKPSALLLDEPFCE